MSTMSELHIRTADELEYLAEVDYYNQQAAIEAAHPCDSQPIWSLTIRGRIADGLYRFGDALTKLARKVDYCPF